MRLSHQHRFLKFLFAVFMLAALPPALYGEESLTALKEKSKSVVSVQGLNAAVLKAKPQAIFNPNTGQILILNQIRPIAQAHNGNGIILESSGLIAVNTH